MINLMDKINSLDTESFDKELFGFGKKYESTLAVTNYRDYFKDGGIITGINRLMTVWEVMGMQYKETNIERVESEYLKLTEGLDNLNKNIREGTKRVASRTVKGDSLIVDDKKYNDLNKFIQETRDRNNEGLKRRVKDGKVFNDLIKLNNNLYNILMGLRKKLKSEIKEVKDK